MPWQFTVRSLGNGGFLTRILEDGAFLPKKRKSCVLKRIREALLGPTERSGSASAWIPASLRNLRGGEASKSSPKTVAGTVWAINVAKAS